MSQRSHNIFFHLHTVSGIVISVGLYVIFFAGAFTLFVEPIRHWEKARAGESHVERSEVSFDYNRLMDSLSVRYDNLYGRDLYMGAEGEATMSLYVTGSTDSLATAAAKEVITLSVNTSTYEITNTTANSFSIGDLFYDLHFFGQLGDFGYYLAGVVSLFFLFAIITGVIVHWKKITLNFFVFRPRQKLKTVWTDAHTALGLIGLPFQFMYALTGAMFCLGIVVSLTGSLLFDGSQEKYYEALYDEHPVPDAGRAELSTFDYNAYRAKAGNYWPGFTGKYFGVLHLGSSAQQFRAYGYSDIRKGFYNDAEVVLDMSSGEVVHAHSPDNKSYDEYVWGPVYRLHFATFYTLSPFSDYGFRTLYFLMALLTCFVIITGVLIWLEARNKKNIPEKEMRFNTRVGHIYLAICLSMLPVSALSFIVSKVLPEGWAEHRQVILNSVFFGSWLLASIGYSMKRDNYETNRHTLLYGGLLGLGIPLVDFVFYGQWPWITFTQGQYGVLLVDVLWLCVSTAALLSVWKMKRKSIKPAVVEKKETIAAETN